MKKVLLICAAAATLAACRNNTDTNGTDGINDTMVPTDTTVSTPTTAAPYTVTEGDIMRRQGSVMVYENGQWVPVTGEITLSDGSVVTQRGEVKRDGRIVTLEEGYTVNRAGAFFDRAGAAIENAWENTKEATRDAAQDIKRGTQNAVDNTREAVRDVRDNMRDTTKRNRSGL